MVRWRSQAVVKPLRVDGPIGEYKLDLLRGLENVWELEDVL